MRYESDDHTIVEYLWNSRDGVTPFCIPSKDGSVTLQHTNWRNDERRPSHKPQKGDRVFVDLTLKRLKELTEKLWDKWVKDTALRKDLIAEYKDKETFVLRRTRTIQVGEPDVITIT